VSYFVTLNGIRLPVAADNFNEGDDSLVTDTRLITGGMHRDLTGGGRKRAWSFTTTLVELTTARAWRALLEGRGYRFGFGNASYPYYSDKGLLMTSASSTVNVSDGPFGGARLGVVNPSTASFDDWAEWSVALWANPGSSWVHRVQTSGGEQYQDGEAWGYSWSATAGSGLSISSDHTKIADVLALPAIMPPEWADDLASATREMAERPYCRLSGECIGEDFVDVLGCDVVVTHIHQGDGIRRAVVSATLREV
jgi:hypothetical protein